MLVNTGHHWPQNLSFNVSVSTVSLNTSNNNNKSGRTYEVNRRFPLAMFSFGRHMKRGKKFLGSVNMPHTLNKASWYGHKKEITKATDSVATTSKLKAADEARQAQGREITVSSDGTWQRKGFVSKNSVVTVLTVSGKECKVMDPHVLSNHCDVSVSADVYRHRRPRHPRVQLSASSSEMVGGGTEAKKTNWLVLNLLFQSGSSSSGGVASLT